MADTPTTTPRVLILYGVPAAMPLKSAAGVPLGKTFELTTKNRESFEPALRQALVEFTKGDLPVAGARMTFVRNAADLSAAIRAADYTHVAYYGHALEGDNALLPTAGNRITVQQMAQALDGTKVTHLDILGCQSSSIAAELATKVKGVKVGYLRMKRFDNVEVNPRTLQVVTLTMDAQAILHFNGAAK